MITPPITTTTNTSAMMTIGSKEKDEADEASAGRVSGLGDKVSVKVGEREGAVEGAELGS